HTLTSHRKLIDSQIENHHGRFVNEAGDSVVAEFASVVEAVNCAVDIQTGLSAENASIPPERRMEFDPKPEKRASDKSSLERQAWSCGRDRGGHAGGEEGTYRRADLAGLAPGGGRQQSGRHLPRTRDQRSHVLHLEEEVFGAGPERAARAAAAA